MLETPSATEDMFRGVLESAPDPIVIVDGRGLIRIVNRQTEVAFGYLREELVGQPVQVLLPDRFRSVHVGHRAEYQAHPRTRPMGIGLELFGKRPKFGRPTAIVASRTRPNFRRKFCPGDAALPSE